MPATARLTELAARKRALVLQADAHREAFAAERLRVEEHCTVIREQVAARGWWFGAAAVAGWLVPGPMGSLLRALPALLAPSARRPPVQR